MLVRSIIKECRGGWNVRIFCLLLLAIIAVSEPVRGATLDTFSVGGWAGGAYSSDSDGSFDHCAANATYKSGLTFFVAVGRNYTWSTAIQNPAWKLPIGETFPLRLRIDAGPWLDATAKALDTSILEIPMAPDSTLITLFRKGKLLEVAGGQFDGLFYLTGTSQLLAALGQCVQNRTASAATTSPVATATASPSSPAPPSSTTSGSLFTGTGIIVSARGEVLTNNHVISSCHSIVVRQSGDVPVTAALIYADGTDDLALLKIPGPIAPSSVASLRLQPQMKAGEQIAVYGFPLAGTLSETGNIVGGNVSALAGLGDDARFFQITAPIQPGNSGGPLLDMGGNVVGVVNMKLDEMKLAAGTGEFPQNVNFAIKGNIASNFLEAHGVDFKSAIDVSPRELSAVADAARLFTVLVACE